MTSLRERLAAKQRRTIPFRLAITDPSAPERDLAEARMAVALADGPEAQEQAELLADEKEEAYNACFEWLTLRAMPAPDFEALAATFPPTDEQKTKDPDVAWDRDGFVPALLAACVDGDLSEEDWAKEVASDRWTRGEVDALFQYALAVNLRMPDPDVGKGST